MSNLQKELYYNYIEDLLVPRGYRKNKKFSLRKKINDRLYSQIFLIFSGSELVSVAPIAGVYMEDIENDVKSSTFSDDLKNQVKLGMPTIFFDASLGSKAFNTKNRLVDFDIIDQKESSFIVLSKILDNIELNMSSNDYIINFVKKYGNSLAVGHHCFRIPFLLLRNREYDSLNQYIRYILDLDFIQNYKQFLDDNIYGNIPYL